VFFDRQRCKLAVNYLTPVEPKPAYPDVILGEEIPQLERKAEQIIMEVEPPCLEAEPAWSDDDGYEGDAEDNGIALLACGRTI